MRKPVINTAEVARAINIEVAKALLLLNPRNVNPNVPYLGGARGIAVAVGARGEVDRDALATSEALSLQARQHELGQALSTSSSINVLPERVENHVQHRAVAKMNHLEHLNVEGDARRSNALEGRLWAAGLGLEHAALGLGVRVAGTLHRARQAELCGAGTAEVRQTVRGAGAHALSVLKVLHVGRVVEQAFALAGVVQIARLHVANLHVDALALALPQKMRITQCRAALQRRLQPGR